ncbi:MAG: hypothetical protein KKF48_02690 [Nanoarchaeota archaeon]|nr:hypothetical protein [Nanoarchaeota archaeon]
MMINISPIYATTIVQKIALYCSSYNGNDVYYLKESIMLMINLYGEENLVEMLKKDNSNNKLVVRKIGEDWYKPKGMKKKLKKISLILSKIHGSYSILEDKTLTKEYKNKEKDKYFKYYLKFCKEFPKIEFNFYALFVFLIQNSSIQNMNISSQYLKVLESGGRTFGGVQKERLRETPLEGEI